MSRPLAAVLHRARRVPEIRNSELPTRGSAEYMKRDARA